MTSSSSFTAMTLAVDRAPIVLRQSPCRSPTARGEGEGKPQWQQINTGAVPASMLMLEMAERQRLAVSRR
eukprot:365424-Chlamydomonas_euryale.AAC.27